MYLNIYCESPYDFSRKAMQRHLPAQPIHYQATELKRFDEMPWCDKSDTFSVQTTGFSISTCVCVSFA